MKRISMGVALGFLFAVGSAANAGSLGTVGQSGWTENVDGSYSTSISGLSSSAGTLNSYTFTLSQPATYYDAALTSSTVLNKPVTKSYSYVLEKGNTTIDTKGLDQITLGAGTYTLIVDAVSSFSKGAFGGTFDVKLSAVPLPAALPLFGSAIAGLGFLGSRRRKKIAA